MCTVIFCVLRNPHPVEINCYSSLLSVVTAGTTFASAVSYAFMRDTYKFSQREYDHQFGKKLAAFLFYIGFNVAFFFVTDNSLSEKKDEGERS